MSAAASEDTGSIARESSKDMPSHDDHHPTKTKKKTSTFKKIFHGIRKNGATTAAAAPLSDHPGGEPIEEGQEVSLTSTSPPPAPGIRKIVDGIRNEGAVVPARSVASESSDKLSPLPTTTTHPPPTVPGEKIIRMDKYGFLLSDDAQQRERQQPATHRSPLSTDPDLRLAKWQAMLDHRVPKSNRHAISFSNTQSKVKYYARRGLPDSMRSRAWTVLTGVDVIMAERREEYAGLVRRAEEEFERWKVNVEGDEMRRRESEVSALGDTSISNVVLETIDRDIHRTFPRHYLFHNGLEEEEEKFLENRIGGQTGGGTFSVEDSEEVDDSDEDENDENGDNSDIVNEITDENKMEKKKLFDDMIGRSLSLTGCGALHDVDANKNDVGRSNGYTEKALKSPMAECRFTTSGQSLSTEGHGAGQAALRRVLRAYSVYDSEVGYCQGMNFISAMFLTFLSEEEAFWLLVIVMNEEPYKLRELFGEDMSGTHEVLYIAEKLLQQFLPKLSQHMEAESINISMFVTPWLLTVYTSTFPFELVLKVWDCFLVEGWKVVYRVMLALMETASKDVMNCRFEKILNYFRDFPNTVDGSKIMNASLKIPLKRKHIQRHVTEWRRGNTSGEQSSAKGALVRRHDSANSSVSGTIKSHGEGSKGSKTSSRGRFKVRSSRDISIEDFSYKLLPIIGASKFAIMLYNVLTPEECSEIIESSEEAGFEPAAIYDASTKTVFRNCTRHIINDGALAENWFERILHALDDTPYEQKVKSCPWIGNKQIEPLHAVSLNEHLRVIKYSPGQFYTKHQDVTFTRGSDAGDREGEKSLVSVHIYLNEHYKGGETRFHGGGRWFDVPTKTGSVLLFEPTIPHEAVKVTKGEKYLVRSDVMYSSKSEFSEAAGTGFTQQL